MGCSIPSLNRQQPGILCKDGLQIPRGQLDRQIMADGLSLGLLMDLCKTVRNGSLQIWVSYKGLDNGMFPIWVKMSACAYTSKSSALTVLPNKTSLSSAIPNYETTNVYPGFKRQCPPRVHAWNLLYIIYGQTEDLSGSFKSPPKSIQSSDAILICIANTEYVKSYADIYNKFSNPLTTKTFFLNRKKCLELKCFPYYQANSGNMLSFNASVRGEQKTTAIRQRKHVRVLGWESWRWWRWSR